MVKNHSFLKRQKDMTLGGFKGNCNKSFFQASHYGNRQTNKGNAIWAKQAKVPRNIVRVSSQSRQIQQGTVSFCFKHICCGRSLPEFSIF